MIIREKIYYKFRLTAEFVEAVVIKFELLSRIDEFLLELCDFLFQEVNIHLLSFTTVSGRFSISGQFNVEFFCGNLLWRIVVKYIPISSDFKTSYERTFFIPFFNWALLGFSTSFLTKRAFLGSILTGISCLKQHVRYSRPETQIYLFSSDFMSAFSVMRLLILLM